jgi:hypothetical protein
MADNIKNKFGLQRKRSYLNRDFGDFRLELLRYANTYFKDKIQDFSEASMGGMFLDMAAYVGDNMSFYLDHQFKELNPATVVEAQNIEAMVRNAGIKIMGNAPASVTVDFYVEVGLEEESVTKQKIPKRVDMPIIKDGAVLESSSGVSFNLTESIDFSDKNENGTYVAETVAITDSSGSIVSFVMKRSGLCVSGSSATQTVVIPNEFLPFRTISLSNPHVTSILRVYDSDGNDYYEVESLAQDTVFKKNKLSDGSSSIEVIASPYRYLSATAVQGRTTTIRFGSGDGSNIQEARVPDPSDMALPLYGKNTFSAYSLDPNKLLQSTSLGVSPTNTTMTILYRYGGGSNHNVDSETIDTVSQIEFEFLPATSFDVAQDVRNSLSVSNSAPASGGASAPSLQELKSFVTAARTMQNRVVTTEDLLARIYTLPTEFGVVYRANVLPNPENALSSILYIISRDSAGKLVPASDSLKKNLSTYLNEFRLIGDAMDVLDASIINFKINIECTFATSVNKYELISLIIRKVQALYTPENAHLGKSIIKSEIFNEVFNQPGVTGVPKIELINVAGTIQSKTYSNTQKNLELSLINDVYIAEPYEIYELRYAKSDISVTVL